ncbi:MAG TPA: LysE family transporter [Bacillota bacterium]|jgi:threonine/homoserine/homoserine lactone efflux protein|nr:LysE family transporter [Bacillota bacterium]HOB86812.1 LysE family transporter [Bacillota bacterium]HOP69274.1 LysE family transporter [Bacillota bacterium]HPT34276.1 LysE family transporter [Bacillota bacterium]HPZ64448.1 LysE family transporter [Bacillota bacterium]
MKVAVIFSTAFVVGLSGSMMPGPVTAVIIEQALKRGFRAGPLVTLGHGIMEAIMLGLLVAGAGRFLEGEGVVAGVIGLVGGAFLAWMGYGMVKGGWKGTLSLRGEGEGAERSRNPVWAGALTTVSNPYWFIWWVTVGAGYVALSQPHGAGGILAFFGGHILSDLVWFSLVALALVTGKNFFSDRIYNGIILVLGFFLLALAAYFCWTGLKFLAVLVR